MGNSSQEQHTLLTDYDIHSAYAEALYTVFANIRFQWQNESAKAHALHVTTPAAYGDYPAIAANLAIVSAQSGLQTILVDADLRNPSLQQRFGLEQATGLSDLLNDASLTPEKIESSLQQTFVPNLKVLAAGTVTAREQALLLSPRFEEVVRVLREQTNTAEKSGSVVLFHSPPVLAGVDAALIGTQAEQTILAIIANRTTRAQARLAQERLEQAHARIAGFVLVNA